MTNLWVTPADLQDGMDTSEYAYEACKSASQLLWALSGRKFTGVTTVTERYVEALQGMSQYEVLSELAWRTDYPLIVAFVEGWGVPRLKIRLRGYPVNSVIEVLDKDGNTIDPSTYKVVEHSTIVFLEQTEWGFRDVTVTYSYGTPPTTLGQMAAIQMATQFAKLWSGDDTCSLPERVTSVTRLGVAFTVLDSQDWINDMRTGIYAVDLFLKSVNPDGAKARARVFSVDIPRASRQPN